MENSSPSQYDRYSEVMLKQKIIHLSSELSKYKSQVKDFRESYQFSRVEKLIEENKKLSEMVHKYEHQAAAVVTENVIAQHVEIEKIPVYEEIEEIQEEENHSLLTHYQEKIAQYEKKEKQWKKALKKFKSLQEENDRLNRLKEELEDKLANEEEYYHNLLVRVSRLNSDLYNANQREQQLQNQLSTLQDQLEYLQANSTKNE
ncbi:hypothetical protein [Peribacillus acanthi]|uniref:hypothetical protein n=1 Tax=Peribacillus acanthi TaxID=2171554 RepID=UPI000D3E18AE|nr:hypothetical protein [Peribacillus acanthi]